MSESIHQEVVFKATPERVYQALMTSDQHSAFTGGEAKISGEVGGAFSCHGGQVVGRNVELVDGQRIVQAWRIAAWDPGVYSIVRFELSAHEDGARLVMDHSSFPAGKGEHLASGWTERYWEPLKKYLS